MLALASLIAVLAAVGSDAARVPRNLTIEDAYEIVASRHKNAAKRATPTSPAYGTVNNNVSPGWVSLGCYYDNSNRILGAKYVQGYSKLTQEVCLQYCGYYGYTYAGVEYGNECYCDNAIDLSTGGYISTNPSKDCNYPCSGDSTEICGGAWGENIFQVSTDYTSSASASKTSSLASYSSSSNAAYSRTSSASAYSASVTAYSSSSSSLSAYSSNAAAYSKSTSLASYSTSSTSASLAAYSSSSSSSSSLAAYSASSSSSSSSSLAAYSASSSSSSSSSLAAYSASSATASLSAYSSSTSAAASLSAYSSSSSASSSSSLAAYSSASSSSSASSLSAYSSSTSAAASRAASLSAYSTTSSLAAYSTSTSLAGYSSSSSSSASVAAAASSSSSLSSYSASSSAASVSSSLSAYSSSTSAAASLSAYSSASTAGASAASSLSAYSSSSNSVAAASSTASSLSAYSSASSSKSVAAASSASSSLSAYSASSSLGAYSSSVNSVAAASATSSSLSAYSASSSLGAYSSSVNSVAAASATSSSLSAYSASSSLGAYSASVNGAAASTSLAAYSSSSAAASASAYSSSVSSAAAAQATVIPSGWTKRACIAEGSSGRALASFQFSDDNMTWQKCVAYCASNNMPLAGVEYARECYCGALLTNGASLTKTASNCDMPCSGAAAATCGGSNAVQLFSLNSAMTSLSSDLTSKLGSAVTLPTGWSVASTACVAEGSSGRALTSDQLIDNGMTATMCINYCSSRGYQYAGTEYSTQCFCGNSLANGASLTLPSTQCSMACGGDATTMCGGPNAISLYTNPSVSTPSVGIPSTLPSGWATAASSATGSCIQEVSGRALTGASYADDSMTTAVCLNYCAKQGFAYAGVEYGRECYCGGSLSNGASINTLATCNMACAADSTTTCGGSNAIQLYYSSSIAGQVSSAGASATSAAAYSASVASYSASASAYSASYSASSSAAAAASSAAAAAPVMPTTLPTNWAAASTVCIAEVSGRALTGASKSDPAMTIEMCLSYCTAQGFGYAGLEYSTECYCGGSLTNGASLNTPATCNMACAGNAKNLCGGSNAIQLYTNANLLKTVAPTVNGFTSQACIQEVSGRALTGTSLIDGSMTIDKCTAYCSANGFAYAGVEYGSECYCGSSLVNGAAVSLTSGQCNMACPGNSGQLCGGPNAIQLYYNANVKPVTTTVNGYTKTACIQEVAGRALADASYDQTDMSVTKCTTLCKAGGFKYAGVEYGSQCYCGNTLVNGGSLSTFSNQCNMPCVGDSTQTCGGPNAINLYTAN